MPPVSLLSTRVRLRIDNRERRQTERHLEPTPGSKPPMKFQRLPPRRLPVAKGENQSVQPSATVISLARQSATARVSCRLVLPRWLWHFGWRSRHPPRYPVGSAVRHPPATRCREDHVTSPDRRRRGTAASSRKYRARRASGCATRRRGNQPAKFGNGIATDLLPNIFDSLPRVTGCKHATAISADTTARTRLNGIRTVEPGLPSPLRCRLMRPVEAIHSLFPDTDCERQLGIGHTAAARIPA